MGATASQTTNISAGQQPGGESCSARWLAADGTTWKQSQYSAQICGCGGDGWMPGQPRITNTYMWAGAIGPYSNKSYNQWWSARGGVSSAASAAGTITGGGGAGGYPAGDTNSYYYGGIGGWGYGSGAGGGARNTAGNLAETKGFASGVLAALNHVLADISSVTVTVGAGGAYTSGRCGGGCNGAVAVFW